MHKVPKASWKGNDKPVIDTPVKPKVWHDPHNKYRCRLSESSWVTYIPTLRLNKEFTDFFQKAVARVNILLPKAMEGQEDDTASAINKLNQLIGSNEGKILTNQLLARIVSHVLSVLRSFSNISTILREEVREVSDLYKIEMEKNSRLTAEILRLNDLQKISVEEIKRLELSNKKLVAMMRLPNGELQEITNHEELHSGKLTSQEVQDLRNQVLQMVAAKRPLEEIPSYQGKRSAHGDPLLFFMKHYGMYVKAGQEVIFAPELKSIDETLLIALRNHTNTMPLGDRSKRTEAISSGRFKDDSNALAKASVAMARRLERQSSSVSREHLQLSHA
jgi:hypothetical protein